MCWVLGYHGEKKKKKWDSSLLKSAAQTDINEVITQIKGKIA